MAPAKRCCILAWPAALLLLLLRPLLRVLLARLLARPLPVAALDVARHLPCTITTSSLAVALGSRALLRLLAGCRAG